MVGMEPGRGLVTSHTDREIQARMHTTVVEVTQRLQLHGQGISGFGVKCDAQNVGKFAASEVAAQYNESHCCNCSGVCLLTREEI